MLQRKGWIGVYSIGLGRSLRDAALAWAVAIILTGLGLTACENTRSFERASDGSTVYIDQLSDAAKAEARLKIAANLLRGTDIYQLEIGDELEIFFHTNRKPTAREYVLRVGDKLRIEFLSETENARTVEVRPDGRISLPLLGPIVAAGQTADALARQLQQRYATTLPGAQITINVTEAHSPLQDFLDLLGPSANRRSVTVKVLTDGTISVPLLPPLKARGRTLRQVQNEIDAGYAALALNVDVSIVPRTLRPSATFILGEVSKPGRIDLERPRTVLMAIAQAGGVTTAGSLSAVRLFYVGDDGTSRVRSINLNDVVNDLKLEEDMIIPDNSIIYVPPTELAKTGRFLDQVLRDILRFQGFSLFGSYLINPPSSGTVIPTGQ
jgi:polysaccharide export outer membrane protein